MQWLIMNMWMLLGGASLFALLLGWAVRGLFSSGRIRKAEIERDVMQVELAQTREEAEALYAAQKKRQQETAEAVSGDDTLRQELEDREQRLSKLSNELSAAQTELEALKSDSADSGDILKSAGAAAAGALAGAVLSDDNAEEIAGLKDRNNWLEERVASLEGELASQSAATESTTESAPTIPAATEPQPAEEKLVWQAGYLRQRVEALETALLAAQSSETPAALSEADVPSEDTGAPDEEMARLRWRNRYLEGRLAYYEDNTPEGATEPVDSAEPIEPEETVSAPATLLTDTSPLNEPSSAEELTEETEVSDEESADSAEPEADTETDSRVHPSDAVLAQMSETAAPSEPIEMSQPEGVKKPSDGGDDLTQIEGVGPKISEVLNGLGIWTYTQIANWNDANQAWIEDHLAFSGRVSREDWVSQAVALAELKT